MNIIEQRITLPNITLNVAFSDNENDTPILLLHGYPDAWFGWEKVMRRLMSNGFRVITPDQRGYNLSDKPIKVNDFTSHILAQDALNLMTYFGYQQFYLAGHDYGAFIAFLIGIKEPNRILRLIAISGFHPAVFQNLRQLGFHQWIKSWYLFFFRLPILPEKLLQANNFKLLVQNHSSQLSVSETQRYQNAWSQPNTIQSMINWYRSMPTKVNNAFLKMPVLILWGENDLYLTTDVAERNLSYCQNGKLIIIENASHWLLLENTEEVVEMMMDFLDS
ncbi:MAG: alpha/beta fold hydrolase [Saprospiraceae bacterium]